MGAFMALPPYEKLCGCPCYSALLYVYHTGFSQCHLHISMHCDTCYIQIGDSPNKTYNIQMFKNNVGFLPNAVENLFTANATVHNYNTRNKHKLRAARGISSACIVI